jgi:ribonuclease Z
MEIKVTILGTSSHNMTAKRNHPGFLLSYNGESILIDCGEGIQRQLKKAKINPCKLTKILITHWHGDHTLGIPGLLQTLSMSEYSKKLQLYGPKGTKQKISLLEELYGRFKLNLEIKEVSGKFLEEKEFQLQASSMTHGTPTNAYAFTLKDKLRLDKSKLKKLNLPNSPLIGKLQEGKNIKINNKTIKAKNVTYLEKGKKITFIMDTSANKNAIDLSKNSNLIICESSFTLAEKDLAKSYKHMTSTDAATIAKKSKSKKLLLTHISQRHEHNTTQLLKEAKKIFKNTEIPKDFDIYII